MQDKILLFIPTYNCEAQIVRVLDQIDEETSRWFEEIMIFDNISNDQTVQAAQKKINDRSLPVKISINPKNVNLGGTHKNAFQHAVDHNFDYCVVLHGDDQADLRDFKRVFSDRVFKDYDYVFGSRFSMGSKRINYSFIRTIGNIFFNTLASIKFRRIVPDFGGSGLNIFCVKALQTISAQRISNYENDLTFHIYLLIDAIKLKQRIQFIPITWREYDQKSNVKIFRQTKSLFRILLKS
jgi:glycosyltransferase involved in cell wall biosynthesis